MIREGAVAVALVAWYLAIAAAVADLHGGELVARTHPDVESISQIAPIPPGQIRVVWHMVGTKPGCANDLVEHLVRRRLTATIPIEYALVAEGDERVERALRYAGFTVVRTTVERLASAGVRDLPYLMVAESSTLLYSGGYTYRNEEQRRLVLPLVGRPPA